MIADNLIKVLTYINSYRFFQILDIMEKVLIDKACKLYEWLNKDI